MEQQQQHRTAWERQLLIRDKNRPTVRDYIPRIFTDFYEMHGDRNFCLLYTSDAADEL